MDRYVVNTSDTSQTVTLSDGTPITLAPGEKYEPPTACQLIDFLNNVDPGTPVTEETDGAIAELVEAGRAEGCIGGDGQFRLPAAPAPTAAPVAPTPDGGDDGNRQGAPRTTPPVQVANGRTADPAPPPEDEPRDHPTDQPDPAHNTPRGQQRVEDGDPVDLFTGALTIRELDLTVRSATQSLDFVRVYRSGRAYYGPFGWSWDHNHNVYLRELSDGTVTLWGGELTEVRYRPEGGALQPPAGSFRTLERQPGLAPRYVLTAPGGDQWLFERPAGWLHPERIPIAARMDRHGNTTTYVYGADDQLHSITDDEGRGLRFTYGDCGLLERVSDHAGRGVSYHHADDVEHLCEVQVDGIGPTRRYLYADQWLPLKLRHGIVDVVDGDGLLFAHTVYEQDPSSWQYGRVIEQRYGDHLYQYRYTQLQWTPTTTEFANTPSVRVEMLEPDMSLTTSTFSSRGDLLDQRYRLIRDGSMRVIATAYGYDVEGNRTSIVFPDGGEELRTYAHDDPDPKMRGLLLQRELRARPGFPSPSRIVWRGAYEPTFQLPVEERDERGNIVRYRYDLDGAVPGASGRLEEIEFPDGATILHENDARGRTTAVTTPRGSRTEFRYAAGGNADGLVDRITRDVGGLDLIESFEYDAHGEPVATIDEHGARRDYEYDAAGQLQRVVAADVGGGRSDVRFTRDRDGNVTEIHRPAGALGAIVEPAGYIVDRFERDVLGRISTVSFASNTPTSRTVERRLDHHGAPLEWHREDGAVVEVCHDESGNQLTKETIGVDGTRLFASWTYDASGRVTRSSDGPLGDLDTRYRYDAFGRLDRIEQPNGTTVHQTWGADDLLLSERVEGDPGDGSRRTLSQVDHDYDERGRLIATTRESFATDPTAATTIGTTLEYDLDGNLARITDHLGSITTHRYDALGRRIETVDPIGNVEQLDYDGLDRVVERRLSEVSANGPVNRRWSRTYDERGRLIAEVGPLGQRTEWTIDDRDLPVAELDPIGRRTVREFDALGQVVSETRDADGLAELHRWVRDDAGRVVRYIDPSGVVSEHVLDGIGRRVSSQQAEITVNRQFGTDGRLSDETLPSGARLRFTYDGAGRIRTVRGDGAGGVAPVATITLGYDGLDRIVDATQGGRSITRRHDSLGRLLSEAHDGVTFDFAHDDLANSVDRRWPDGRTERLGYDAMGRLRTIRRTAAGSLGNDGDEVADFSPLGRSRTDSARFGGVVDVALSYDEGGRLTALDHIAAGAPDDRIDYRYDRADRRALEWTSRDGTARRWEHDGLTRVVNATDDLAPPAPGPAVDQAQHDAAIASLAGAAGTSTDYGYSAGDERLTETTAAGTTVYGYGPGHELASIGGAPVTHHADGPRSSDDRYTYSIDAFGRVTRITETATGATVDLGYDPLGRILTLTHAGSTRTLHHVGDRVVQEDLDGALHVQHSTNPAGGHPPMLHVGAASFVPVTDASGSMTSLFDVGGLPIERYRYEPFGRATIEAPAGAVRPASVVDGVVPVFAGLRQLPGVELYLAGARVYDPATGLFLSRDPLGFVDSHNPYAYARHDPADFVDPSGELAFLAILGIMAVGAVVAAGFNAARQGIAIAEGAQEEFSWGELALNAGIGAVLAPVAVFAPEVAIPLAAMGIGQGLDEYSRGNYATGTFDIVTSVFGARSSARSPSWRAPLSTRVTNTKVAIARADLAQREVALWGRRALTRHPDTRNNINNELVNLRVARAILNDPDLSVSVYDTATRTARQELLGFDPARDLGWDGIRLNREFTGPNGKAAGDLDISLRTFDVETKAGQKATDISHKVDARNNNLPERSGLRYLLSSEVPPDVVARAQQYPRAVPGDVRGAQRAGFDGHLQIPEGARIDNPRVLADLAGIRPPELVRPSVSPKSR